jgi:hypothetical protein
MNDIYPIHKAPYTNFHDMNLDWIIEALNEFNRKLANFVSLNTIKYADPIKWDITSQYAQNTLVLDPQDGTAYLSVQPVPQGVQITNTDYWTPVFTLQNFIDPLKNAITAVPQQENGQTATEQLPANSVFFVGDVLCTNPQPIPQTSLVVIGTNCIEVSVVDLISRLFNMPTAWYRASDTSINLGFPPSAASTIYGGDVHVYSPEDQTITITGR